MGHPEAIGLRDPGSTKFHSPRPPLVLLLQLLFLLLDLVLVFFPDYLQLMRDDRLDTHHAIVSRTKLFLRTITRTVTGRLLNELPQQSNFPFDSLVLWTKPSSARTCRRGWRGKFEFREVGIGDR